MAGWARSSRSASSSRGVVGEVAGQQLAQPRRALVVGGQHEQHGQRADALAQVGAGRLAGLPRLGQHVDEVVGQLEGGAEDLADQRATPSTWSAGAPAVIAPSRAEVANSEPVLSDSTLRWCSTGSCPSAGPAVSEIWPSTRRAKVSAWMRTGSGPRPATTDDARANR